MNLWRIAAETRTYGADDLSGGGAAKHPGRWNDHGQPVVYTASSIAPAVLETAAHIDDGGLPLNRYLVKIELPDVVWRSRTIFDVARLPVTWAAIPPGWASVQAGAAWLRRHDVSDPVRPVRHRTRGARSSDQSTSRRRKEAVVHGRSSIRVYSTLSSSQLNRCDRAHSTL